MKHATLAVIAAISSIGIDSPALAAGDIQAGKVLSAACAACHGANGQGMAQYPALAGKNAGHGANGQGMAQYPALAGKNADQLVQALKDFKSGKRDNVFMKGMASSLSDRDIENVAAYYASLK